MREVGPATQTLGGLLRLTNRDTFRTVEAIASEARVPVATCRKHLDKLDAADWIKNIGRQHTKSGAPRRTCTILVTEKTRKAIKRTDDGELVYGVLPVWATWNIRTLHRRETGRLHVQSYQPGDKRRRRRVQIDQTGHMPWSSRAVLSIVLARLMSLAKAVEEQDGHGLDAGDVWGSIANMGVADRFQFSLRGLAHHTGLTLESITIAKKWLHSHGIIQLGTGKEAGDDGENVPAQIMPSASFRVTETPASEGRVYVDLVA
jgi:DNA-binding MarR family transcriptional regulator